MSTAEKLLHSKKLMEATEHLLTIGIEDNVGATMFCSAKVSLSSDKSKIEIVLEPNDYYMENYERIQCYGIPGRKELD